MSATKGASKRRRSTTMRRQDGGQVRCACKGRNPGTDEGIANGSAGGEGTDGGRVLAGQGWGSARAQ
eukprot:6617177-Prymnesium_polylepis.1